MSVQPWNGPDTDGKKSPWDTLYIDDVEIPGLWKVTGEVGQRIDIKPVKGNKGVKTTNEGPDAAELTMVGELDHDEAEELESMIDDIHPRNTTQFSSPRRLEYPAASFLGISVVRIKSISLPALNGDLLYVTIKAVEYFDDPKPANERRGASTPAKVYDQYSTASNPWAPTGVDVLDSQWPANPPNVQGNTPFGA